MKKQIISLLLALIMVLSFTACSSGAGSDSSNENISSPEADSEKMLDSSPVKPDLSAPIDFEDITGDVPDEPVENTTTPEDAETPIPDESAEEDTAESVSGIRPEFQEAMDSYEAFYDEYIDLLQQYSENPTDLTLLNEYMDMMTRVVEMDEQFNAWEDEDLSTEEALYFSEVSLRISEKMIEAAQYMQ